MKKIYLTALLVCASSLMLESYAQYEWFNEYKAGDYAYVGKIAIDKNGNLFAIGGFKQSVNVGGTVLPGSGSMLIKLNPDGEVMWFHQVTYDDSDFGSIMRVATDGNGDVYITAIYGASASIAGKTLTGSDYRNGFLAKFNTAGDLLWTRNFHSLHEITMLSVNDAGDVAVAGPIAQAFQIENVSLGLLEKQNSFCALFNADGELQWAKGFGEGTRVTNFVVGLAVDQTGIVYMSGRYSKHLSIDGKSAAVGTGHYNFYLSKISRQGVCEWIVDGHRKVPEWFEEATPQAANGESGAVTTDDAGNAYVTSTFWNDFKIGGHHIVSANPNPENLFVARFNPDGTVPWINTTMSPYGSVSENVFFKNNKLFNSGLYRESVYYKIIDPETGATIRDKEQLPLLGELYNGLAVDDQENVYICGRYYIQNVGGDSRGFLFKIKVPDLSVAVGKASSLLSADNVCDNGVMTASVNPIDNATSYEWEVSYNGITVLYQTTGPSIEVPVSSMAGASSIHIKVRGVNGSAFGEFSTTNVIVIRSPEDKPIIQAACNDIQVVGDKTVRWYHDGVEETNLKGERKITPSGKGSYYATEENACGVIQGNTLEFEPIFVPNIITPNGDQKNEVFILDARLHDAQLSIMNRWGHRVYFASQYQNDWTGDNQAAGVYFYSIIHPCYQNAVQGSVTVSK